MQIEFISTGDEVLSGQIVDTNASWVSQYFLDNGRAVTRRHTVADDLQVLIDIITETSLRADVVIMNGGLGPTSDDLSAEAAAKAMGVPLELSHEWLAHLKEKYLKSGRVVSKSNEKQAWLPQGSTVVDNPVGTACGFSFVFNKAKFYFTPGVPSEFKHMIAEQIMPDISASFEPVSIPQLIKMTCFGVSESALNEELGALALPDSVTLGFRASLPIIEIKLLSTSITDLDIASKMVKEALGAFIVAEGDESIADVIQAMMIENKKTLSLAESCSGGMIASELIAIAGSSAYLDSSHVTYSNAAKSRLVDVKAATIARVGAVSCDVAAEMANGARINAKVDYSLAVSGIAGPGGGSDEKPVGTVAFALSTPSQTYTQLIHIPRWNRQGIRIVTTFLALDMLRRELQEEEVFAEFGMFKRMESNVTPNRS